jgi:hypothetical protein
MLSTVIRDFGLAEYERPSLNLRQIVKALDEMKAKDILLSYKVENTHDGQRRNKIIDSKIILTPHPYFANEIKKANARAGRIRQDLEQDSKSLPNGK